MKNDSNNVLQIQGQAVFMKEDWATASQSPQIADDNWIVPVKPLLSICAFSTK